MESIYRITINIKVVNGWQEIGSFTFGSDRDFAFATFDLLQGTIKIDETALLRLDLVEQKTDGLDIIRNSLNCTLQEQAGNCKIITREMFKFLNIEK